MQVTIKRIVTEGPVEGLDELPGLRLAAIVYEFIACRLANHALAADSQPQRLKNAVIPPFAIYFGLRFQRLLSIHFKSAHCSIGITDFLS